jgi:uncharacterized OsmC-like protein
MPPQPPPIAYPIDLAAVPAADGSGRRVAVHALTGMQKEAQVSGGAGGAWRLLCDEGPYLNGTDLAPFPLGFFAAGQVHSLAAAIVAAAAQRGLALDSLVLRQADRYTMQGSFLRGDANGGALPPEFTVIAESDSGPAAVATVLRTAVNACPALRLLRDPLSGVFTLTLNGRRTLLSPDDGPPEEDPAPVLQSLPPPPARDRPDLISKLTAAAAVAGVPGGAGSSLQAVQNRTLLIQGEARRLDANLLHTEIGLAQPIGSIFRFLGPARDGAGGAPDSPDYLAAGIAFCFMTQLGRYAHIKKFPLRGYRLVQHSRLAPRPAITTHVFLDADLDDASATDLVRTGERTCFLHAALRSTLEPVVRAEHNGAPLPF